MPYMMYGQNEERIHAPVKELTISFTESFVDMSDPTGSVGLQAMQDEIQHVRTYLQEFDAEVTITRYMPEFQAADTLRVNAVDGTMRSYDWSTVYVFTLSKQVPFFEVKDDLESYSQIEWVDPPISIQPSTLPDDYSLELNQWNLDNTFAEWAWDITQGDYEVRVMVLDFGIRPHDDIDNKIVNPDMAVSTNHPNHGLQVAGIVGAESNNNLGLAALGWETMIVDGSFEEATGPIWINRSYGSNPVYVADIINMSFYTYFCFGYDQNGNCIDGEMYNFSSYETAVNNALAEGVNLVASAGNTQPSWHSGSWPTEQWPAAYEGVIAVSAVDIDDIFPSGYNSGSYVNLSAPGIQVPTLTQVDGYANVNGTSFSAPHAAATVSLMKAIFPDLTPAQAKEALENSADNVSGMGNDDYTEQYGYGRLNAFDAVKYTIENYGATLGGTGQYVFLEDAISLQSGAYVTILAGTELYLYDDFYVGSGASLEIEEGATINFRNDDVKIIADGDFSVRGAFNNHSVIHHRGNSGNEIIANNGATIWRADITGVDVTVSGSGKTASLRDSRFLNGDSPVTLYNLHRVVFQRNLVDNASDYGLWIQNITGWSSMITRNTISNSGHGIWFANTEIEEMYDNVIEDFIHYGLNINSGSDIYLVDDFDEDYGRNRIKAQYWNSTPIFVSSNSTSFLGDGWIQGRNTVYNTDFDPNAYIVNNNSFHTVNARYTYWGSSSAPSSDLFSGSVNYSNHLTIDYTGNSGSPLAKMSGSGTESEPEEDQRKEMLLDLISRLDQDSYGERNDHRLSDLYLYMQLDRRDEMGLRDQILATISEWSSRRSRITSDFGDSPQVRRAVETAMLLEIRLAFRNQDYELARQLNDSYRSYIQTTENKVALWENEVSLNIYQQDYNGALIALDQGRKLASGESFNSEDTWVTLEQFLNKRLEQQGEEAAARQGPVAQDGQTDHDLQPNSFTLKANYPNPFNPVTVIPFTLPEQSHVRLEVYDILGRQVSVLADRTFETGRHETSWDASQVTSGLYIVRMAVTTEDGQQSRYNRTMSLVK